MMVLNERDKRDKLNKEIDIIISETLQVCNNQIIAIILYGSYGRGEGAFFLDKENNIRTYNDFDLVLVVNKLIDQSIINKITTSLNDKLDVKWIDISQKTKGKLQKLKLTIFNFDLKNGSRVIYGDDKILNTLPNYDVTKLSLKEAETLYFTRIWTFLGALPIDGFERELKGEEIRFYRNQMAKAILAVVDVLLLQKKCYDSSYRKRTQKAINMFNNNPNFIKWANWAIDEKCNPKDDIISVKELNKMYSEIATLFLKEMHIVLSKYYRRNINEAADIEKALKFSISEWLDFLKSMLKTRSFRYVRKTKVKIAQSYLMDAFFKEGIKREYSINKVRNLIKEVDSSLNPNGLNWNELRLLVTQLRMDT